MAVGPTASDYTDTTDNTDMVGKVHMAYHNAGILVGNKDNYNLCSLSRLPSFRLSLFYLFSY